MAASGGARDLEVGSSHGKPLAFSLDKLCEVCDQLSMGLVCEIGLSIFLKYFVWDLPYVANYYNFTVEIVSVIY